MDVVAHFLWTFALYFKRKERWLAALFGVLPDILSFGPFFIVNLLFQGLKFGKPEVSSIPPYIFTIYNLTHSLIIFLFVFCLVFLLTKKVHYFLGGWLLHILIDIPTHTKEFFPTPFLWPISDFKVSIFSWGTPWFMILNYTSLLFVYFYISLRKKNRHHR